mgnify:CR=1 FL=1
MSQSELLRQEIIKFRNEHDEYKKRAQLAYDCMCKLTQKYNAVKHQEVMGDKS